MNNPGNPENRSLCPRDPGDGPIFNDLRNAAPDVTAVILAGGKSSRMGGVNKALLKIDGIAIIEREIAILDGIFKEIIIISNSPDSYRFLGKPIFPDIILGKGSLGGLYTGLKRSSNQRCFLAPCDMPFLRSDIIRLMLSNMDEHDVIIPRINGHLEPMHAIYSKKCIPIIERLLQSDDLKIIHLLDEVDTYEIAESSLKQFDQAFDFTMNVNTPRDLEMASIKSAQITP